MIGSTETVFYDDLIFQARKMRAVEYDRLSVVSFDTLEAGTSQSIASISELKNVDTPDRIFKVAALVYTLIKLRKDHYSQLMNALKSLRYERYEQIGIFVSFVYSKLLKHTQKGYTQEKLEDCVHCLKSSQAILPAAYLIYFLAKYSPNSILLCISQFVDATMTAILHSRADVRYIGFESLKLYFQILNSGNIPHSTHQSLNLFLVAQQHLGKQVYREQHGSFLIFAALLKYSPQSIGTQASELMRFFASFVQSAPFEIRQLSLYNLVLLGKVARKEFVEVFLGPVTRDLIADNSGKGANSLSIVSLLRLVKAFPEFFHQFGDELLVVIETTLVTCNGAPLRKAFTLLKVLLRDSPSFRENNVLSKLACTLIRTLVNRSYIANVPEMFFQYPVLWSYFMPLFKSVLLKELPTIRSTELLELLSKCPLLESSEIVSRITNLLTSQDAQIRSVVPWAFMAQSFVQGPQYEQTLYRLATMALSDPSPDVRANVLRAFPPNSYKFLTIDPIFSCLATLVKDSVFEVRNAAIELLGHLSKVNPFDVMPVLRKLLLDDLFLLDSPRPLRIKEEMTRSFHTVISAAYDILPMYSPTLCDISLRQLSFTPTCELTYFERQFINNINLNITKAIGYIAERDVSLIAPHIPQFVNFFFWLLQQHGPKKLKLALVTTLYVIMTGKEKVESIDVKQIFTALEGIASKWNSRKLNVAVLKLMGFIGAIDITKEPEIKEIMEDELPKDNEPGYFASVAAKALITVLSDDSVLVHHTNAINALVRVFCDDITVAQTDFDDFMPLLIEQVRKYKSPENLASLTELCTRAPKPWVKKFASELIELVKELWKTDLQAESIHLIPVLACVLMDGFMSFVPECVTFLLDRLYENRENSVDASHEIIVAITSLCDIASDYLFLVYPEIVECLTDEHTLPGVKLDCLICLRVFVQKADVKQFALSVVSGVLKIFEMKNMGPKLQTEALNVLYLLTVKLGDLFAFFGEQVANVLTSKGLLTPQFIQLLNNQSRKLEDFTFIDISDPLTLVLPDRGGVGVLEVDEALFRECVAFHDEETPWNWKAWYHSLVIASIEQSPSAALRACAFLGRSLFHIADNIWNHAFLSIWLTLSQAAQLSVAGHVTRTLLSQALPNAISSSLVSLLEFMERTEHRMQISRQVLCQTCMRCSQYEKCCFFAQRWYEEDPHNIEAIETLIRISKELGLNKTIQGISAHLQGDPSFENTYTWCEQLGQWSLALEAYKKMEPSPSSIHGILRCLKYLQRWDEIISMIPEYEKLSYDDRRENASIIATALVNRQQWSQLPPLIGFGSRHSVTMLIIEALYQISQKMQDEAINTVERAFNVLADRARSSFKHDKTVLHALIVKAQQLQEITEIAKGNVELDVWRSRMAMCRQSYEVYHQILTVRLTVFKVEEMMKEALRMVKFALKDKDFPLFESSLNFLFPDSQNWPQEVAFLHARGRWFKGHHEEALEEAKGILTKLTSEKSKFKAKVLYTCGQWIINMTDRSRIVEGIEAAVWYLEQSIAQGTHYFHAWHRWAWACSVMYGHDRSKVRFALNAINGFLECVRQRTQNSMSELLQMIALFFDSHLDDDSFEKSSRRISTLDDGVLLMIMPQLFTQLPKTGTRTSIFVVNVLRNLLPKHYHVLLYPLLLLMRSSCAIASDVFQAFSDQNPRAASEAITLSNGLVDCSISVLERWVDMLNETIIKLHQRDISSAQQILTEVLEIPIGPGDSNAVDIGKELRGLCPIADKDPALVSRDVRLCHMKIKKILSTIHVLPIHTVAPDLAQLRNSALAIPGTYSIHLPIVNIAQLDPNLDIYNSKQRPRLVKIYGTDGSQHWSLLKGKEDMRLDQRVMLFFALINQHIKHDYPNETSMMQILTYAITPLAKTAGLIQFVNGADTMYYLISEYRTQHNREVFEERKIMENFASSNCNTLLPIQRLEALRMAQAETCDTDLREIIWLNSPSATEWISRSLRFTHSSALMSIVGYFLGLGDRHPSNLMIHRFTGTVIHIDFSDCFEVRRHRIIFAEKVPFRLTRMMIRAFGPIGIEGPFRLTCEQTAKVIRSHKDSVTAVLDIFLQEPLDIADSRNTETSGVEMVMDERQDLESSPHDKTYITEAMKRLMKKLAGNEFGNKAMNVQDQVTALIETATNMYNLASLYHGWTPLW